MKIDYQWLKEFVSFDLNPKELAELLTIKGTEVERIELSAHNDTVFSLELTPNRPDCMSHLGIAREVAAILGKNIAFEVPQVFESNECTDSIIKVEILDADLCSRYCARVIRDVNIKPSPSWMQRRLENCGIRAINNVVDCTNYVLLEMGHPLHAFDLANLSNNTIRVRPATKGEKITTIDGIQHKLEPEMLVITDAVKPVAVAGVMGGLESEVTENTVDIVLESAYFDPVSIRRTSKNLGMRTESSMRFERGADIANAPLACDRAAALIAELGNGQVARGIIDIFPKPEILDLPRIPIRLSRVQRLLGIKLDGESVRRILEGLNIRIIEETEDGFIAVPPSYRLHDLMREADLIEEIARIYGYDRIGEQMPAFIKCPEPTDRMLEIMDEIKNLLPKLGLNEVITYHFSSSELAAKLKMESSDDEGSWVKVLNPLVSQQDVMRRTLLVELLNTAAINDSVGIKDLAIFELGARFSGKQVDELPEEAQTLAILLAGSTFERIGWRQKAVNYDFYYLKGILETIFNRLGYRNINWRAMEKEFLNESLQASVHAGDRMVGYLGEISLDILESLHLEPPIVVAEVYLDRLAEIPPIIQSAAALPRFPFVSRDLAIIVPENIVYETVHDHILKSGAPYISSLTLYDIYRGKQIPLGYTSFAFSLRFLAQDRTLTDDEVDELISKILAQLAKLGISIRDR